MKPYENGHHLAQAQAMVSAFLLAGTGRQLWMLTSQQRTAEIVNVTKDGYHIQAELQWNGFGDQR